MAAPDKLPHALAGDPADASAAMTGLRIDDPAIIKPHQIRPSPSTPNDLRGDDDDEDDTGDNDDREFEEAVDSLVTQWHVCIDELRQLQEATPASPIYGLSNLLKAQQQSLDKSLQRRETGKLSRDNYTAFRSVCWYDRWAVVKKCRDLIYIDNVSFPRSPRVPVTPGAGWIRYKDRPFREKPVVIDAVVDNGATWLKFMSISTRTLEFQILSDGTESDDDSTTGDPPGSSIFVETISKIVSAAQWNHCPHVHLVLPRLVEGESAIVDKVLSAVRNMAPANGQAVKVTISCANSEFMTSDGPELPSAIRALVGGRELFVSEDCHRLTSVVNLDPSALASLVSDLHHGPIPLQPQAQQDLLVYTLSTLPNDIEETGQVPRHETLSQMLLPALRGRKLVCTASAAKYFRQLIGAISTSSEEARASLILPPEGAGKPHDELIAELQKLSNITILHDLLLPIEIMDDITLDSADKLVSCRTLPPMALDVARDLSPLNRSVYLNGWAHRMTTVTGHRGIHRQVQLSVARHWKAGLDDRPPDVWHRLLNGSLFLREKPKDWRERIGVVGGEVPPELIRWTLPWTTWGRGIDANGVPDTKTWPGVGHEEMLDFGRKTERRARGLSPSQRDPVDAGKG